MFSIVCIVIIICNILRICNWHFIRRHFYSARSECFCCDDLPHQIRLSLKLGTAWTYSLSLVAWKNKNKQKHTVRPLFANHLQFKKNKKKTRDLYNNRNPFKPKFPFPVVNRQGRLFPRAPLPRRVVKDKLVTSRRERRASAGPLQRFLISLHLLITSKAPTPCTSSAGSDHLCLRFIYGKYYITGEGDGAITSPATSTGGTCCSTCCRGSLQRAPHSGSRGSICKGKYTCCGVPEKKQKKQTNFLNTCVK